MADKEPSTSFEIVPTGERKVHSVYKGPGGIGPTEGREWRVGPGGLGSAWHNPRPDLFHDRRDEGRREAPT